MQLNRRRHDIDTEELEGGSYDELEAQLTQFHRPGEELGDGSRKMWLYFAALQDRTASAPSLADAQTFVPESRRLDQSDAGFSCSPPRPFATPCQGETTAIAELARKGVFVAYDRKVIRGTHSPSVRQARSAVWYRARNCDRNIAGLRRRWH